ncbi:hypothetical protein TWF506_007258 [Arthrobotrys conoides]|uniref:Uncharacterized protein n=1 Tax=Arthrobotrys conoides TaxID=74498 RepID=A0AAN8N6Y7_9PEZI
MSSPDNNKSEYRIPQRQKSPEAGNSHSDSGNPVDPERVKDENGRCDPEKLLRKTLGRARKGTNAKNTLGAKGGTTHNPQS